MCDPIPVTLLKMQPHNSQSSRENATPSSGTSPVASYKEVPPPPGVQVSFGVSKLLKLLLAMHQLSRLDTMCYETNDLLISSSPHLLISSCLPCVSACGDTSLDQFAVKKVVLHALNLCSLCCISCMCNEL